MIHARGETWDDLGTALYAARTRDLRGRPPAALDKCLVILLRTLVAAGAPLHLLNTSLPRTHPSVIVPATQKKKMLRVF